MILQENVNLIINLTKVKEYGKVRCDHYWPVEVGESVKFSESESQFSATLISSESLMKNLIKRKLRITNDSEDSEIGELIQLHYLSWPDHGAPEACDYQIIEKLLEYIQEYHRKPMTS